MLSEVSREEGDEALDWRAAAIIARAPHTPTATIHTTTHTRSPVGPQPELGHHVVEADEVAHIERHGVAKRLGRRVFLCLCRFLGVLGGVQGDFFCVCMRECAHGAQAAGTTRRRLRATAAGERHLCASGGAAAHTR